MCRRVTEVDQSDRRGARVIVRVRGSGHRGRAAGLRQRRGSGESQLHVRLSVASLHFVFPFLQHCSLKVFEIVGTFKINTSLSCLSGIAILFEINVQVNMEFNVFFDSINNLNGKHAYSSKDIVAKLSKQKGLN